MGLEEYKDIIGAVAQIVTICQMFSGGFVCKDIYKKGSTTNIPATPFIGGCVISGVMYQYAVVIKDSTINTVNTIGTALSLSYLIFYFFWTDKNEKSKFYKDVVKGILVLLLLLGFARLDPEQMENRLGIIITVMITVLTALPLFSLGEVIKTNSTESLPFPMILSGLVVSVSWLLYGLAINNDIMVYQNIITTVLSAIEISLFAIFPRKVVTLTKKQE